MQGNGAKRRDSGWGATAAGDEGLAGPSPVSARPGGNQGKRNVIRITHIFIDKKPKEKKKKRQIIKNPKHAVHKRSLEILKMIFNFGFR